MKKKMSILSMLREIPGRIFSVKNENTHKVVSICGIKFKKNIYLNEYERKLKRIFISHKIRKNSVLLTEVNHCHGECLPGIAKYFSDLGYNIDVLISTSEYNLLPFASFKDSRIQFYTTTHNAAKVCLKNSIIRKYRYVYINSDQIGKDYFTEFYKNIPVNKDKLIIMTHSPGKYPAGWFSGRKFLMIANIPVTNSVVPAVVNPHYFGEIPVHKKNAATRFIVIGNIEGKRRNYSLLIETVKKLANSGISNFKVTVIARCGNLELIDKETLSYIDFKGKLSYKEMYKELEKADFFLTLLDFDNPNHYRYLTEATSGSFQLIYGFNKPCLIQNKFAQIPGLNSENALCYNTNSELFNSMCDAIRMSAKEYEEKQRNLKSLSNKIYALSLNNLKTLLEKKTVS